MAFQCKRRKFHQTSTEARVRRSGLKSLFPQPSFITSYHTTAVLELFNQTVNDGVAHSKNPKKCAHHVTFDLDLDLEHTLDASRPGVHRVQVWWRSGHLSARRSDLRKSLQTDRQTDRRMARHCISSFLE